MSAPSSVENEFFRLRSDTSKVHFFYNEKLKIDFEPIIAQVNSFPELRGRFLFPSSGTSGRMKWITHTAESLMASAQGVIEHLQITTEDVQLLALPQFHVGGFSQWVRAYLSNSTCLLPRYQTWSAPLFVKDVMELQVSLCSLVPAQVYDLVKNKLPAPEKLRAVLVGGAALEDWLYIEARKLNWPLLPSYGMTEAASTVACASLNSLSADVAGLPAKELLSQWWASEVDTSSSRLKLRGPALFNSEFLINAETGEASVEKRKEEFFTSSDLVEITEETNPGRKVLRFIGRGDEQLKILGEWVNLDTVREKVAQFLSQNFPQFNLAGSWDILAKLDKRNGYLLSFCFEEKLLVESERSTFLLSLNKDLGSLEKIHHLQAVECLPKSPLGKVLRTELGHKQ